VARFISDRLIPSILSQAWDARDRGEATVAPVLEATHEMMRSVLDLMVVRAQWLQGELGGQPRTELIGVQQLEPDLLELRWETVRRLREAAGFDH
jgi:hypothetical protein